MSCLHRACDNVVGLHNIYTPFWHAEFKYLDGAGTIFYIKPWFCMCIPGG